MQLLVLETFGLPAYGNKLLNGSSCLDDLLYSNQSYCRYFSYYRSIFFRYRVGFSICCLTFLWQQKPVSEIIVLPVLTASVLRVNLTARFTSSVQNVMRLLSGQMTSVPQMKWCIMTNSIMFGLA